MRRPLWHILDVHILRALRSQLRIGGLQGWEEAPHPVQDAAGLHWPDLRLARLLAPAELQVPLCHIAQQSLASLLVLFYNLELCF
jgi:hypothetical protein